MQIIKRGDLVYSFASKEFYIILKVHGSMAFSVYSMNGQILETIDVTLTHINTLESNYKNKYCFTQWVIDLIILYNKTKKQ